MIIVFGFCFISKDTTISTFENAEETYSKLFVDVTLGGVAMPGVAVRELCPDPSRVRVFPAAFRVRDDILRMELN
jgi:hypothetical protein